jgi:voltage-gated potassium channel
MAIVEVHASHRRVPRKSTKEWVYHLLEGDLHGDPLHIAINVGLITLIVLNVADFVLSTVGPIRTQYGAYLRWFEAFSVIVFTIEYALRAWSCTAATEYRDPWLGRLHYLVTPLAVVDLFAVLPFYLTFLAIDARFIRVIRVYRLFRLAKLARYSAAMRMIVRVIDSKREELAVSLFCMVCVLLIASSLMYFVENPAQPEKFSSIPASMWWAVVTLTTIGYGDVYPVTSFGKTLASVIALVGVGAIALPAGILGAAFMEEIDRSRRAPLVCPHCGNTVEHRGLFDRGPAVQQHAHREPGESPEPVLGGRDRRRAPIFQSGRDHWPTP